MTPNLMPHFVQCAMAKDVRDAVKRSYLDASNSSQVYKLTKKTFHLLQGGRHLTKYHNELNYTFMKLDYRMPSKVAKMMWRNRENRMAED